METNSKIPTRKTAEVRRESLRAGSNSEGKTRVAASSSNIRSVSRNVGTKELKENVAPLASKAVQDPSTTKRHPPIKSMMGYMELKRKNQDLTSELQTLHGNSDLRVSHHLEVVAQLSREIEDHKAIQAQLRSEIKYYQGCLQARNLDVDALQHTLEQIKFENERLTSILEGASIDGLSIKHSTVMADNQHQLEMDFEVQNAEMDDFVKSLETSLSQLQGTDLLKGRLSSLPS